MNDLKLYFLEKQKQKTLSTLDMIEVMHAQDNALQKLQNKLALTHEKVLQKIQYTYAALSLLFVLAFALMNVYVGIIATITLCFSFIPLTKWLKDWCIYNYYEALLDAIYYSQKQSSFMREHTKNHFIEHQSDMIYFLKEKIPYVSHEDLYMYVARLQQLQLTIEQKKYDESIALFLKMKKMVVKEYQSFYMKEGMGLSNI